MKEPNYQWQKRLIITLSIIISAAIALAISYLVFGTDVIYIGDKMPPVDYNRLNKQMISNISVHFVTLFILITLIVLPQIIILCKTKIMFFKKDIFFILLYWIIPLIVCFIKLKSQYGFTF